MEDVQYLVRVPEGVPMPVASMLPSGGLWAMNTVFTARQYVERLLKERGDVGKMTGQRREGRSEGRAQGREVRGRWRDGRERRGRAVWDYREGKARDV